jgi:hypothetical protein
MLILNCCRSNVRMEILNVIISLKLSSWASNPIPSANRADVLPIKLEEINLFYYINHNSPINIEIIDQVVMNHRNNS